AAASRFLYHFLAVRAAYKKMMFYPLQVCVSRLAATDRQQYFVDGLKPRFRQRRERGLILWGECFCRAWFWLTGIWRQGRGAGGMDAEKETKRRYGRSVRRIESGWALRHG
ncbi:MAG: hypothetical protein IJD60_13425, partial [Clostridia bacterium]|nr:hypothetical protein [Clostridia bacterium]